MSRGRGVLYVFAGVAVAYAWLSEPRAPIARPGENESSVASDRTGSSLKGEPLATDPTAAPLEKLEVFGAERYVTASSLRLRVDPSSSARVSGSLKKGTRVLVLGTSTEWHRVSMPDGTEGWAHGSYLSTTEPVQAETPPVTTRVSVRSPSDAVLPKAERTAIARKIIERSIDNYSGNCACPYNTDRAGRACGRRSAYSKPGGENPVCYVGDVTDAMIDDF